jgi:hypothetical protein
MNDIFHDLLDMCIVVYLDDILIYPDNLETHQKQVKDVLQRLQEDNLHARPEKRGFHRDSPRYFEVKILPHGDCQGHLDPTHQIPIPIKRVSGYP